MVRTALIWGAGLAAGAFVLQLVQYRLLARTHPEALWIGVLGLLCAGAGVWLGATLTARRRAPGFQRNEAAIRALGLTPQEMRALEQLAAGRSNKEIARAMGLSPNTVKTHLANLFAKLDASRRTEAVAKARELGLAP